MIALEKEGELSTGFDETIGESGMGVNGLLGEENDEELDDEVEE